MTFLSQSLLRALCVLALAIAGTADAKIVRIAIEKTEPFDGAYQRITGTAIGELDPADPLNAIITDIQFAPKSSSGKVEYSTKFTLTKPLDMTKSTGILWYDFVNRGAPVTAGNGHIRPEQQGHIALISGWQGDLAQTPTNWTVKVPPATNPDGSPITGVILARIANAKGTHSMPLAMLGNAIPYDAASMDTTKARVIVKLLETRAGVIGSTRTLGAGDFAFGDCTKLPFPGTPNPRMLCLKEPFDPAFLYEVTYEVKNPLVLGIGLAAVRDIASFFRFEAHDVQGTANPVAGAITHAIVQGVSQSGNALKTFLLQGFNQDEGKRKVFDGANPHIAGRLTAINVRFGLPSGSGTLYEPGGEGVLWWTKHDDPARGRPASSLLDRCTESRTCPKIFETFGAAEFNARLMTVALLGTDNKADLPLPANVRRYYFPGTTHGGDNDGGFNPAPAAATGCVLAKNPNPETETMNALRTALAAWVKAGTEPPPSVYPRLADGQLVPNTAAAMGWPAIPNAPSPAGLAIGLFDYDFGDKLSYNDFRGVITKQPPAIRKIVPPLMPKLDADGNETAGIPSLLHQAPLGTYTGWNVTADGFFKGQPCGGGLTGGYIPFPATKVERIAKNDPRRSLEERYGSPRGYMCVLRRAATRAVATGFLLPVDAQRLLAQAESQMVLPEAADGSEALKVEATICK